jgi:hypothetical protein
MPATELMKWAGYFKLKEKERAKQEAIAKAKSGGKGGRSEATFKSKK